jgi:hypothetical protein
VGAYEVVTYTVSSLGQDAASKFPEELLKKAKKLAAQTIKAAVSGRSAKEVFQKFDTVDFKAGAIRYSGRNYIKIGGREITISRTWGLKPYVAFRWRGSAIVSQSSDAIRGLQILYDGSPEWIHCDTVQFKDWEGGDWLLQIKGNKFNIIKNGTLNWIQTSGLQYREWDRNCIAEIKGTDFSYIVDGTLDWIPSRSISLVNWGGSKYILEIRK